MNELPGEQPNNSDPMFKDEYDIEVEPTSKKRRSASYQSLLMDKRGFELPDINASSQQEHDGVFSRFIKLRFISMFVEAVEKIPTYFPKNFYQQFKLQFFDDKNRLYIWDYINRRWNWAQLNIDEYETTQVNAPDDQVAGNNGWIGVNPGTDSNGVIFANGFNVYSSTPTDWSWINSAMGFNGLLDFDNQQNIRFEITGVFDSVAGGDKLGIGFIDPNTTPPIVLTPTTGYDKADIERKIAFIQEGTQLYAVIANGTTASSVLIPGVTLSPTVTLRFKFLWNPTEGTVKFYVNDELKAKMSGTVPTTAGVNGLFVYYAGTANASLSAVYPKLGIQIN